MEGAVIGIIIFTLLAPLSTAHFASSQGRSFWLWFFLTLFLPGISMFILIFLPDKSVKEKDEQQQNDEAGKDNAAKSLNMNDEVKEPAA